MFGQKQIDSIVQRIKSQAQDGNGFHEGENRSGRKKWEPPAPEGVSAESKETLEGLWNEV